MRKTVILLLGAFLAAPVLAQGPDKAALEKAFMERLASYEVSAQRTVPERITRVDKNLYCFDGGTFEVETVRNRAYFSRGTEGYKPVRDTSLLRESVYTLLSGYTGDSQFTVHLKQHRYNYSLEEVNVPLEKLLLFCIEGCAFTPYVGIEKIENGTVKASLFLVNMEIGYCHTFNFTFTQEDILSGEGVLDAYAYTFTPINNLAQ